MVNPNQAQFGGSFQQPPQQQKGCLGRNWKWMLPVGCLGLLLGAVALVGAVVFVAMSAVKSSEVYQGALKVAQSHPAAVGRLGEPVKDGWFVTGNVKVDASGGNANFEIPLSGPKKSGTLHVRAVSPDGAWIYEQLDLSVEGEEKMISLLDRNVAQPPPGVPIDVEEDADDGAEDGESEGQTSGDGSGTSDTGTPPVSGGALDAKAVSKPNPPYPPAAKAARASGLVTVRVTVDETGHVVSAEAVSGHPLLRQAAVAAARQARLTPTLLSGEPVKVTGVLTYNFVLEQ